MQRFFGLIVHCLGMRNAKLTRRFRRRRKMLRSFQVWASQTSCVIFAIPINGRCGRQLPWCVALGWWLNGFGDTSPKAQAWFDMDGWKWWNQNNQIFFNLRSHPTETSHLHHFNQVADVCWYPGIRISRISRAKTTEIESTNLRGWYLSSLKLTPHPWWLGDHGTKSPDDPPYATGNLKGVIGWHLEWDSLRIWYRYVTVMTTNVNF